MSSRLWLAVAFKAAMSSELMLSSARKLSSSESLSSTAVSRMAAWSSNLFLSPVRWVRSSSALAAILSTSLWSSLIVVDFLIESRVTLSSLLVRVAMVPSLFESSAPWHLDRLAAIALQSLGLLGLSLQEFTKLLVVVP